MTNSNCLENIACPKCGNDEAMHIEVKAMAFVTDDGAETNGYMDWDCDSFAVCPDCGKYGTLGEFTPEVDGNQSATEREE